MKKLENSFAVTGFIGKDAEIRSFQTASVARFSIAISRAEKEGEETTYVSSFMGVEAWRKNEALDSFDVLKKGNLVTVEGYFKPEEWTDAESGAKRSRIVMVATMFSLAPEKEEEKPPPKQAATKKKKSSKSVKRLRPFFFLHRIRIGFAYPQSDPPAPSVVCFPCLPLSAINGRRTGKRNTLFIPYPSLSNPVNTVNEPTRPPKEESSKAKPCFYLCVHAVLPTHPSAVWLFRPFSA